MPGQMQEGFGCAIANRFDQLFDDESDPFELLKQAEAKKKEAPVPGAAKTSAAQAAKQPKKESQKTEKSHWVIRRRRARHLSHLRKMVLPSGEWAASRRAKASDPRSVRERGPPTDRRPVDRRPPRRFERPAGDAGEKPEGGEFSVEKPIGDRPMRGRGGGGPRGAPRGGSRGRGMGRTDGFDSRGKREFDRHSGSDRTSSLKGEEKRGGSGSHNWGTVKDDVNELDQSNVTEENPEGEEHPPADSENKENEVEEVKEEGPKEMTLDEWKAVQDKERAKVEFNIRKANEGADWNKGFVLHKSKAEDKKEEVIDPEIEEPKLDDEHHFRKPANDITSQLEINFGDLGRPSRGRGGPRGGGGRGGRGRGGPGGPPGPPPPGAEAPRPIRGGRTDKSSASVPNVDDPEAFPALA
ncbi:hypothetical protein F7725_027578 [Dissostichus mawsoni]|uniref:Hyaluronan/mRNA-binding protein domain-containing protein n=1 Tax=Dissostichus mawsoni TaxID=36200 RepID=A0A7J5XDD9_DISMA|nr:hypothetical protein F7725_027578 [Dissostichus mawsoni]